VTSDGRGSVTRGGGPEGLTYDQRNPLIHTIVDIGKTYICLHHGNSLILSHRDRANKGRSGGYG